MSSEGKSGGGGGKSLQEIFLAFCAFGKGQRGGNSTEMDSKAFAKLFKDSGLLHKKNWTTVQIDLCHTRHKPKGLRTLNFSRFEAALKDAATKRFPKTTKEEGEQAAYKKMVDKILAAGGPSTGKATKAQPNKFHDDKSLYTGVYKQGGPTNVDNKITLSNLLDRSPSDARGRKTK